MKRLSYALVFLTLTACDQTQLPPTSPVAPKTLEPANTPAPTAKPVVPAKAASFKSHAPELDLSVSDELIESLDLAKPVPPKPLLPELLGAQDTQAVRLNGRLITSEEPDKLIDGAELSLEIKN